MGLGSKPFLSYDNQIALLKSKGLKISDAAKAKEILLNTGYFSLINGYKEPYKNSATHRYNAGTTLEDIYTLYQFDHELRFAILEGILYFERKIKSSISYHFSESYGCASGAYMNFVNYSSVDSGQSIISSKPEQTLFSTFVSSVNKARKKVYIDHYLKQYNDIPLWTVLSVLSMGSVSYCYSALKDRCKRSVAKDFSVSADDLESFLKVLTHFRNVCAHNERLYCYKDSKNSISDTPYHQSLHIARDRGNRYKKGKNDILAVIISLKITIDKADFNNMVTKIDRLIQKYNIDPFILDEMGLVSNWTDIVNI